ncbi:hypothetical protein [Rothia sp. CCM 9416]|uniref:hypothetical protein n=1 Tax=Rothia sp. CCM 9416 TaxID=3402655 RepID=UPI003AD85066
MSILPDPRITEPRFWVKRASEPAVLVLRKQRVLSTQRIAVELAEKAAELRAEAHQVDRVIQAYRREHGLSAEQIRQARRNRPAFSYRNPMG